MEPQVEIKYVILFAAVCTGTLMLVECVDGSLRLLRDETPIDGVRWDHHQIEEAAAEFRRRLAEMEGKGN